MYGKENCEIVTMEGIIYINRFFSICFKIGWCWRYRYVYQRYIWFYSIKRYYGKKKFSRYADATKYNKFYLGRKEQGRGHILENVVYLDLLRRGYDVYIGKVDDYKVDLYHNLKLFLIITFLLHFYY